MKDALKNIAGIFGFVAVLVGFVAVLVGIDLGLQTVLPPTAERGLSGVYGEIHVEYVAMEPDSLLGTWDPSTRVIQIEKSLPHLRRKGVLAHELCHAAISDVGLVLPDSTEEFVCNAIETQAIATRR
jgi:hypothetical protein